MGALGEILEGPCIEMQQDNKFCKKKSMSCVYLESSKDGCSIDHCPHENGWICNDFTEVCRYAKINGDCEFQKCIHILNK